MTLATIYITAASQEEALAIGRALVEARLAACANVFPGVTSIYWWEGSRQEDSEVVLILKTRQDLVDEVVAKVKELHSYECPCVVAFAIAGGNKDFLDWIARETK